MVIKNNKSCFIFNKTRFLLGGRMFKKKEFSLGKKNDDYSTTDLKFNSFEFYTLLGVIAAAIVFSIICLSFVVLIYNKVNQNTETLNLGVENLRVNKIDTCTHDCDVNLCFGQYNTLECLGNIQGIQVGCRTKEQCYSICVEWYKGNIETHCFSEIGT